MNRKNKKRAFITSIIMLLISAIVLTSSTFAWFVMGDKATIDEMDIKLYSSEGIQISANATDPSWRQMLTLDNLFNTDEEVSDAALDAYAGNRNMLPEFLIPASSSFNSFGDYGYPNFYRANVEGDGTTTVTKVVEAYDAAEEAGIVAFDIFIKTTVAQTIDFSKTEVKEITAEGGESRDPLTAIRYAFVPMGNEAIGTAAATCQQLQNASASKVTIAEADSNARSADSEYAGNAAGHKDTLPLNGASATEADMKNVILNTDTAAPQGKVYWSDDETKTFDLDAGITKIRVYIWAEGNDIDCRDSIASSELSVAFKFAVAEA